MPNLFTNKVAEIRMSYSHAINAKDRVTVNSSRISYDIFMRHWSENIGLQEEFYILLLDRSNRVIGHRMISRGGVSSTLVDLRIIFACALKCCASAIIFAHNHPSGNLQPSEMDKRLTSRAIKAGELLQIKIWDHIIVAPEGGYYSFADNRMMY